MLRKIWRVTLVAVAGLLFVSLILWVCLRDYAPVYNQPLSAASAPVPPRDSPSARGMWPERPEQDDRALVLVAISGGGTRAAAVGWQALETLRTVPYRFNNAAGQAVESNLANEVDLIAGISGGSFTATAWCLGHDEMLRFRTKFVERDIQIALAGNFVNMKGLRALFSGRYSRINWAAELYDQEVFDRKTFAALPDRPILRLHATNLALGQRFTFIPETFAALASDLSAYPLGYACAASSAFPILLDPMTLRNYPPPLDLAADLPYQADKLNAREDLDADLRVRVRDYYNDKGNAYVHLADGGLVDNQGLQSILDEFMTNGVINKRLNYTTPSLQRLIIININAGVAQPGSSGRSADPPGVFSVVESTMVASMDVLSERRWMDIKKRCGEVMSAKIDVGDHTPSFAELEEPYRIEISFRNIKDSDDFRKANALPTSFKLTQDELKLIDRAVPVLLKEDPEFERLNKALGN